MISIKEIKIIKREKLRGEILMELPIRPRIKPKMGKKIRRLIKKGVEEAPRDNIIPVRRAPQVERAAVRPKNRKIGKKVLESTITDGIAPD